MDADEIYRHLPTWSPGVDVPRRPAESTSARVLDAMATGPATTGPRPPATPTQRQHAARRLRERAGFLLTAGEGGARCDTTTLAPFEQLLGRRPPAEASS